LEHGTRRRSSIMELFLIVFVYMVYKAMTYDVSKLDDKAWEKYARDLQKKEKDNGK
jgi:hypothetical protein